MTGPETTPPATDAPATQTGASAFGTLPQSIELTSAPPAPEVPGYELLGELGRGGMGVVFKARQIKLNRLVALKMLPAGWHNDRDLEARFRTEAEAVAKLQHPNIVQIFEVGEAAGRPFLALEFVPGGTLAQFLGRRPQTPELAAQITESLARAVHHAHTQGILHRDLKPGNILLHAGFTAEGAEGAEKKSTVSAPSAPSAVNLSPKIADFGLAKRLNASDGPTQVGDVIGTPSYMAPEQASGVASRLTPGVDIYALGAILYEMLTGRPPFLGATPTETVVQVLAQDPVTPRDLRPDCPRDLQTICLKCLEKNVAKRYSTAEELADDLRRYSAGEPINARPAGRVERLAKWMRRRPGAAAAIAVGALAVVLVLLLSAGFSYRVSQKNEDLRTANERERESAKRARANFERARQVVKEMLAEVAMKDLESVPQMDPVRRSLLQKALRVQQDFLAEQSDDPDVMRDLARTHDYVGEIHYMLGDYPAADRHFAESADLFERLGDAPEVRLGVATALMKRGDALLAGGNIADAELFYVRASEEADRLVEANAGLPDSRYVRDRIRVNYGRQFARAQKFEMAENEFRLAANDLADLAERYPTRAEFRERRARALNNLGALYMEREKYKAAAPAYHEATTIMLRLRDEHPGHRDYRLQFAFFAGDEANSLWWNSATREADKLHVMAIEEYRRLVGDFPHVPDYRHRLAHALEARGEVVDYDKTSGEPPKLKDASDGLALMREALAIKLRLVEEQPQNVEFLSSVAMTYDYFAAAASRRKRFVEKAGWELAEIKTLKRAVAAATATATAPLRTRQMLDRAVNSFGKSMTRVLPFAWMR